MGRRGNGEGSFRQRSDGRWEGRVWLGGARRSFYGTTRRETQQQVTAALREAEQGVRTGAGRETLAAYLERWLEEAARPAVKARTFEGYASIVRVRIVPRLGRLRLSEVESLDVQRLCADLQRSLSAQSVVNTYRCLHRALDQAVRWGLILRNPCDGAVPPAARRPEVRALTAAEASRLLASTMDAPHHALYMLALATGMRQGELLALRWADVDFNGRWLSVRRSAQQQRGKGIVFVEPKTRRSRRRIALGRAAAAALARQRASQADQRRAAVARWIEQDLVFTTRTGGPLDAGGVRRVFARDLERAGLPRIRFHDLRHTAATLLLQENTNPKVVSEMLGHSGIAITLDIYSHVVPSLQEEAAAALDRLLDG
jgi:integrase